MNLGLWSFVCEFSIPELAVYCNLNRRCIVPKKRNFIISSGDDGHTAPCHLRPWRQHDRRVQWELKCDCSAFIVRFVAVESIIKFPRKGAGQR